MTVSAVALIFAELVWPLVPRNGRGGFRDVTFALASLQGASSSLSHRVGLCLPHLFSGDVPHELWSTFHMHSLHLLTVWAHIDVRNISQAREEQLSGCRQRGPPTTSREIWPR